MTRLVISSAASADQAQILIHLNAKAGKTTAAKFRGLFRELYDRLTTHPDSGSARPALGTDIRIGIVAPYIVIDRHPGHGGTVEVLRVVDGRRRISARLLRTEPPGRTGRTTPVCPPPPARRKHSPPWSAVSTQSS